MKESMLDVAYEIVESHGGPLSFSDMLLKVGERLELDEEALVKKAAQLYTNLLRDGRFVTLGENTWDLRTRHKFDKVHIDMNDIYREDDEDEEEKEKEKETGDEDLYDTLLESEENIDGFGIKSIDEEKEE